MSLIITNNVLDRLGFIKCSCNDFHDDTALKLLYFSLVRSHLFIHLEYADII